MDRRCFTAAVLLGALGSALPGHPASAGPATIHYGGTITRAQTIARAHNWLSRGVRYSQDNRLARWDVNKGRRYRPDCSGFVCMAWAIDPRHPRYGRAMVTWELPRVCTPIAWPALQPGDMLLFTGPRGHRSDHVRLFETWLDPARTRATILEASSTAGAVTRKTVTVEARYKPYRYRNII